MTETDHIRNQNISLLKAFDAMRNFLEHRWNEDGQKSDELASLLGNLGRSVLTSSAPMDAAQWSDWLDAVIRVSPDFDAVKEARRKIQMQYEKGLQILKIASPGERNVQLKELGKEKAISGWHLVGDHSISASLAYRAMQAFLMEYWERGHRQSQDIEAVLNDLDTGPDVNGGCWSEWLNAIRNNKQ